MNFKENESAQKLRGGYYTDADIASFLSRWALEKGPKNVLEPACGDGVFLEAIADVATRSLERVEAWEIIPAEAQKARRRGHRLGSATLDVHTGDFLEAALGRARQPSVHTLSIPRQTDAGAC